MGIDNDKSLLTAHPGLHQYAEERLSEKTAESQPPRSEEATELLLHDLEVRQIELEMQNELLRTAKYEVETALKKFTDLYEAAPVAYFTLDRNGSISALNLTASNLLRIERSLLIERNIGQFISEEYRSTFTAFLGKMFNARGKDACHMVILNNVDLPISVQVGATISTSGEECHIALIDTSMTEAEM